MTELDQEQVHYVIKPEYLWGGNVHLAKAQKPGLMQQRLPSKEGD